MCACVRAGVSSGPAVCAHRDERNAIVCGDRRGVSGVKIGGVIELVRASRSLEGRLLGSLERPH